MSSFLSRKYLKYQNEIYRKTIDTDLACATCGYNVRGLVYGRACPECGTTIEPESECEDVLLAGGASARVRWRIGLAIACVCLVGAVGARLLLFVVGATGLRSVTAMTYLASGFVMSGLWFAAVWLVTPPILGQRFMFMGTLRWVVRVSQGLWIPGYIFWMLGYARSDDGLIMFGRLLRFGAGIGVILLAAMLIAVAYSAQREDAARRLRAAAWVLPIATILTHAFPAQMQWIWLVVLGMLLLFWAWGMLLFALAVGELQRHVRWAMVDASLTASRDQRVAETRREYDRALEASVRPPPKAEPELPFDD